MGRKKKKSGSGIGGAVITIIFAMVVAPKGGWTIALLLLLLVVVIGNLFKPKSKMAASSDFTERPRTQPATHQDQTMSVSVKSSSATSDDEFFTVSLLSEESSSYRIASSPFQSAAGVRWVAPEDSVEISGVSIARGMFYSGSLRPGYSSGLDACVINLQMRATKTAVDFARGPDSYWMNYDAFTDEQRYIYLQWLASDRTDPSLHESYARLYLCSFERRVYIDAVQGKVPVAELEAIERELRRFLNVYARQSITAHGVALLELISLLQNPTLRQYEQEPLDSLSGISYELPLSVRVAFGQAAVDKKPVPAGWALAWALNDPMVSKRTPVTRCSDEFRELFERRYRERFKDGLTFSANKTKLKAVSSPAFYALRNVSLPESLASLPDITAVSGPRNKIQQLVDECSDVLDAYSRYLGRKPEAKGTLDGFLLLPTYLWPEQVRDELDTLSREAYSQMVVTTFGALFDRFKSTGPVARDKVTMFTNVLAQAGVAVEPDVRLTGRTPKASDSVALFASPSNVGTPVIDEAYEAVALMVDLASLVATADGNASATEMTIIERQIDSWPGLAPQHRERLRARSATLIAQPPTVPSFKKRLEPLSQAGKDTVATLLVQTANADGVVSPSEVKVLEKIYRMLGRENQQLYSDLHGNAAKVQGKVAPVANGADVAVPRTTTFSLDTSRIEALQKETAKVSALLAGVFVEEQNEPAAPATEELVEKTTSTSLLGLDQAHSTFLRLLLTRSAWTRSELEDAASDLELMVDGAIEQVNEASLDHWDESLTDGDDPVEINQELAQRLAA